MVFEISNTNFPLTSHLTQKDTFLLNKRQRTSSVKLFDSLYVVHYFKDTIWDKKVYLKNIIYRIHNEAIYIDNYDSTTNIHKSKLTGYNAIPTRFFYDEGGRITRIKCDAKEYNYYNMVFNLLDNKNIIIKCSFRRSSFDSIKELENLIVKNKLGNILTSTFYHEGKSNDFTCYLFIYDKHNNLIRINRRTKAEWIDYTEKLYTFKHKYKNGKLIKTKVHYNFDVADNDIVYLYNERGLISEEIIGSYKTMYEYEFMKN